MAETVEFSLAVTALVPGHGDDAFMNTNLVKFDFNEGKLPREIEEILCTEFAVLPMEIEILNPDLIIFFTGPDYDERLLSTFNCYRVYQGVILEPIVFLASKKCSKWQLKMYHLPTPKLFTV
ncbi:hypothetical protein [Brevibacillus nitrificans]|uniref:hypothetical protein n=1 Tax=Brevibacillus nitrificans TaxID=651560 RepID=UPI002864AF21|nr:hypothetical protein [Brevibacillus nitrificans]MDR7318010.1 hypothetical protein [Brevibacillus nitrificans]